MDPAPQGFRSIVTVSFAVSTSFPSASLFEAFSPFPSVVIGMDIDAVDYSKDPLEEGSI